MTRPACSIHHPDHDPLCLACDAEEDAADLRAENASLRSQLAALTPKPERFDAEAFLAELERERCPHDATDFPFTTAQSECRTCQIAALRAAYTRGYQDAPNLDEKNHRAAWAEADRLRGEVTALREALQGAKQALLVPADECLTWQRAASLATAAMRSAIALIDAALSASPPKPEPTDFFTSIPEGGPGLLAQEQPKPSLPPYECCGCSCFVCIAGHREGRHTGPCQRRLAEREQPKPDAGPDCRACDGLGVWKFKEGDEPCPDCSGAGREPGGAK